MKDTLLQIFYAALFVLGFWFFGQVFIGLD